MVHRVFDFWRNGARYLASGWGKVSMNGTFAVGHQLRAAFRPAINFSPDSNPSGSLSLAGSNIPIGYQTPKFPSLQFPVDGNPYESPLLFRTWDIYRFTVYWHLIVWTGAHLIVGSVGALGTRKKTALLVIGFYLVIGAFYAFSIGSIIGLLLAALYHAGALHMTTWIPFGWSFLTLAFLCLTNFSITSYVF